MGSKPGNWKMITRKLLLSNCNRLAKSKVGFNKGFLPSNYDIYGVNFQKNNKQPHIEKLQKIFRFDKAKFLRGVVVVLSKVSLKSIHKKKVPSIALTVPTFRSASALKLQ